MSNPSSAGVIAMGRIDGEKSVSVRRIGRRATRRRLTKPHRLVAAIFVCIGVLVGAGFVYRQFRIVQLRAEVRRVQAEIKAVEIRNENLRKQIEHMNSLEYVEKVAREKLGLVMPGETVYDIAEPKEFPSPFDVPKRKDNAKAGY